MSQNSTIPNHSQSIFKPTVQYSNSTVYSNVYGNSNSTVAALGNTAKSLVQGQKRRWGRYDLHDAVRRLLPNERVARCMCQCGSGGVGVVVHADGVAAFRGVVTCGSVWACPICSTRISAVRRGELDQLLKWGRAQSFVPVLLTLTMRHGLGNSLPEALGSIKRAKERFHQSKAWRMLKCSLAGHVTATEATYGAAGWHPHYHVLLLVAIHSPAEAVARVEALRQAWIVALAGEGLTCNEHGFAVQGAAAAGNYVAKWGPAEELALSGSKTSRDPRLGRTPWQLLRDYVAGDRRAGALFVAYTEAFHGRRQLVWSPGLKDLIGLGEIDDAEAVALPEGEGEAVQIAMIPKALWRYIVAGRQRARVLDVAELEGASGLHRWLGAFRASLPAPP